MNTNKILWIILIGLSVFSYTLNGQEKDKVLATIDGEPIYLSEFTRILNKNAPSDAAFDLEESLRLFINFKLKVKEAERLGLDTTQQFVSELAKNREEIAKPYLLDQEVSNQLLEEAYQRSLEEVRSSHILIAITPDAPPSDTLRAYQKAMKAKNRLESGESFEALAKEISEDPSAKTNGGDLGYYTVFQLVYPFENAIYNTPIGQITDPVRTQFGYHIIQVTDRRPARGELQVAVILKAYNFAMTEEERKEVKQEILRIDSLLKSGEDFGELAKKYSDDRSTGNRGGVTRWFGVGAFPTEFENVAFSLESIGDVSEPFETEMGWYIIQLIDKNENQPKEEVLPSLARTINRYPRSGKSRTEIANKLKQEYNFQLNRKNYEEFYRLVDPSIFDDRWDPVVALQQRNVLFTLGDRKVLQKDFAQYLYMNMKQGTGSTIAEYVDREFEKFVEAIVLEYEDTQLEKKYPEFKALYNEFKEGNLLFEIMDEMVWSKAAEDSAGLQKFYEANRNNYLWEERADGYVIRVKSAGNPEDFANRVTEAIRKHGKRINSKSDLDNQISMVMEPNLEESYEIDAGPFAKGTNRLIDSMKWKKGEIYQSTESESVLIAWIQGIKPPEPKLLKEAKGQILADYQDYLEQQWVKNLRAKYAVMINDAVLESIK